MRFMIIVKGEQGLGSRQAAEPGLLAAMSRYNEELAKAGVLLAGEGLQPSSKGARVRFSGDRRIVIDGPFTETKELIAGFWLWQVKSAEDFAAEFTPELREQEERLRAQVAQRAQKR